jgi:hypothetical protein
MRSQNQVGKSVSRRSTFSCDIAYFESPQAATGFMVGGGWRAIPYSQGVVLRSGDSAR